MPTPHPAVVLDRVSFSFPDGTTVLEDISGAFGRGRTGLVGRNGAGKSTLLRLAAGVLSPTSGHVVRSSDVAYLPQRLTVDPASGVDDLLGIRSVRDAIRAVERGDVDARHFDVIGDDWDIEARARAAIDEAGLNPDILDRGVGELSGGEAALAALAGIRLRGAPITLLDEPTNNLDRGARRLLADAVHGWRGTLVVVSHDSSLLELMDDTAELYAGALTTFGGPYSAWRDALDAEQEAAQRAERDAERTLRKETRQRIDAETTLARRARTARKAEVEKRLPKIIAGGRKQTAEVSAGRLRTEVRSGESAGTPPIVRSNRSRAGSVSGSRSHASSSRPLRRSCSCLTSPRTTWISTPSTRSWRRCRPTAVPSSW